jgi:hypothetical protein
MGNSKKKQQHETLRKKALADGKMYVGRNDRCPCGSGKKAKKCCLPEIQRFQSLPPAIQEHAFVSRILGHDSRVPTVPPGVAAKFEALRKSQEAHEKALEEAREKAREKEKT